jgi:hypothetical protein
VLVLILPLSWNKKQEETSGGSSNEWFYLSSEFVIPCQHFFKTSLGQKSYSVLCSLWGYGIRNKLKGPPGTRLSKGPNTLLIGKLKAVGRFSLALNFGFVKASSEMRGIDGCIKDIIGRIPTGITGEKRCSMKALSHRRLIVTAVGCTFINAERRQQNCIALMVVT